MYKNPITRLKISALLRRKRQLMSSIASLNSGSVPLRNVDAHLRALDKLKKKLETVEDLLMEAENG